MLLVHCGLIITVCISFFQYLEKRFSRGVRLVGTCIFSLQMVGKQIYKTLVSNTTCYKLDGEMYGG